MVVRPSTRMAIVVLHEHLDQILHRSASRNNAEPVGDLVFQSGNLCPLVFVKGDLVHRGGRKGTGTV